MLHYPWRDESNLLGSDHTASKFCESGIQDIIERNREIFEPDSEAVTEALEWLRNNHSTVTHSYDPINDQENIEIQPVDDESSPDEVFNEQLPLQLAVNSQTTANLGPSAVTMHNQLTEISDDQLHESVRSINNMQCKAYDKVLSWNRNKMKTLNSLKSEYVEPIYLFITGGALVLEKGI